MSLTLIATEVHAHGVVASELEGELQLGAHAVGTRPPGPARDNALADLE